MRRLSVAQALAAGFCLQQDQLSALWDAVEQGEAVEITRRGVSEVRLVQALQQTTEAFDLAAFCAPPPLGNPCTTGHQPMIWCGICTARAGFETALSRHRSIGGQPGARAWHRGSPSVSEECSRAELADLHLGGDRTRLDAGPAMPPWRDQRG